MSEEPVSDPDLVDEEDEEVDDDFLFHLYQGGELLQSGSMEEAREQLEKAFVLKPKNPRGQNLLGLVYFKLGLFYRAIEIYRNLVIRFPQDVTLRVNLAMVYLKSNMLPEAEGELHHALLLVPDYQKAHRYLGLVLAKKGDKAGAREHFAKAGVPDLERFITVAGQEGDFSEVPQALQRSLEEVAAQGFREIEEREVPFQAVTRTVPRSDGLPAQPEGTESWRADTRGPAVWTGAPSRDPSQEIFTIDGPKMVAQARGRLYTRLASLWWMEGELSFSPLYKRFAGEETKHPFTGKTGAMVQVEGNGELGYSLEDGENYYLLRHPEQSGYFVEDLVFSFSDTSSWENGRLQSEQEKDIAIFHLFNCADLVVRCCGIMERRSIGEQERFLLDTRKLVGWIGPLVPRLLPMGQLLAEGLWLELRGSGEVYYLR